MRKIKVRLVSTLGLPEKNQKSTGDANLRRVALAMDSSPALTPGRLEDAGPGPARDAVKKLRSLVIFWRKNTNKVMSSQQSGQEKMIQKWFVF